MESPLIQLERLPLIIASMIKPSCNSTFCRDVVKKGILSEDQMYRAVHRYKLGCTKSKHCIFWMFDRQGHPRDGHVDDQWVSKILREREAYAKVGRDWKVEHCLFGLHLLDAAEASSHHPVSVAIVDSEPSAVILSEIYPKLTWMAHAEELTLEQLEPLQHASVTFYPRTDPSRTHFLFYSDLASQANHAYPTSTFKVSSYLEDRTTEEQKQQEIDLLKFLISKFT